MADEGGPGRASAKRAQTVALAGHEPASQEMGTVDQQPGALRQAGGRTWAMSASVETRATRFMSDAADRTLFAATRAIVIAARNWRKLANDRIKPLDQTMARWETLFHVAVTEGNLNQRELAALMGVEGPTMVRMLDRLAREGLIERWQSGSDRRVTNNRITDKGIKVVEDIMQFTNNVRAEILQDIDPERLAICVDVLQEIIERIKSER